MSASPERADAAAGGIGEKDLLRLLTCGSVDDGKSTLIGRLLYDTRRIFADQLSALEQDFEGIRNDRGGDRLRPAA